MNESPATARLRAATDRLAGLRQQFERARLRALLGVDYDADAFDALVLAYRHAAREAAAARRALAIRLCAQQAHALGG